MVAIGNSGYGVGPCPDQGGIVCPTGGIVLVSRDGGDHWQRQVTTEGELSAVDATGSASAIAWGPGTMIATVDGGATWRTVALPGPGMLQWLSFASPTDGWVGLQSGCTGMICGRALFATRDGGVSWTELAVSGPYPVKGPHAQSILLQDWGGYLGGGRGWIGDPWDAQRRTSDGGATWVAVPQASAAPALLATSSDGAVAWGLAQAPTQANGGYRTQVLHTTDGWKTWSVTADLPGAVTGLRRAPNGALWAITTPHVPGQTVSLVMVSADRGAHFASRPAAGLTLFAIAPTSARDALAVAADAGGTFEIVATTDGGATWAVANRPAGTVTPGPTGNVGFWTAQDGWGIGTPADHQAVLVTHDGGASWVRQGTLPGVSGDAVFTDAAHGWLAGPGLGTDRWLTTDDGGQTWRPAVGVPAGYEMSFTLSDPNARTVAAELAGRGSGRTMILTGDGGRTWSAALLPPDVIRLAFDSPRDGWAVDSASPYVAAVALLLRTTDAGRTWTPVTRLGATREWTGPLLASSGPRDVWLVQGGMAPAGQPTAWTLLHTTDGGRTWAAHTLPAPLADTYFYGDRLSVTSAADGWLLTRTGLWRTTDGGASWTRVSVP